MRLDFLPSVGEPVLLLVIEYILAIGTCVHYPLRDGGESTDLLVAVLDGWENGPQYGIVKRAALFAGALRYHDELETAADRIARHARQIGVVGLTRTILMRELRQTVDSLVQRQHQAEPDAATVLVHAVLPDAPVASGAVVPRGWRISAGRTESIHDLGRSIPVSALVVSRGYDVRTHELQIELAYWTGGRWRTTSVAAKVLACTRAILELANIGLDVTCLTAGTMVQFLDDYATANQDRIPTHQTTAVMGWQGNSELFVVGRQTLSGSTANSTAEHLRYRHPDDGTDAIADGYSAAGDAVKWSQIIAPLMRFPTARLVVHAAITAPLLRLIGAPNFFVDICGPTSGGKTTVLEIGASALGNPSRSRDGRAGIIGSWDSTQVWREKVMVATSDLPFFVDDTKTARFVEDIPKLVYLATSGLERGRATPQGTQRRESFRTVVISTGEEPVIKLSMDGGVRPRILTVWGSPFDGASEEIATLIQTTRDGLRDNHGHLLPGFVKYLQHCDVARLKERYRQKIEELRRLADNERGFRLAESAAEISLAGELVHDAFFLPWPIEDPVQLLWNDLLGELEEGDVARDALRQVAALLVARRTQFATNWESGSKDEPFGGWLGRWHESSAAQPVAYVGVIPAKLNAIMVDLGFRCPDAIYREWNRRGWLLVRSEEGRERTTYSAKINGTTVRLVAIRLSAIKAAGGEAETGVTTSRVEVGAQGQAVHPSGPSEQIGPVNVGGVTTPEGETGTSQRIADATGQAAAGNVDRIGESAE